MAVHTSGLLGSRTLTPGKQKRVCTKTMYTSVHCSFILNSPKVEATQVTFRERVIQQLVHLHRGTLCSHKKE